MVHKTLAYIVMLSRSSLKYVRYVCVDLLRKPCLRALLHRIVEKPGEISGFNMQIDRTDLDRSAILRNFSRAIQFRTISHQDPALFDPEPFRNIIDFLRDTYPLVHSVLERETPGDYSLLFSWNGSNPSLKPVLLVAHLDVVPIATGTENDWLFPPFSGEITGGYIWGRGTVDYKIGVTGILEAIEILIKNGFQPERSIYVVFGHDEETGGEKGAVHIAGMLAQRGIEFDWILDEGGYIYEEEGLSGPVATIGLGEKGYLTLKLAVHGEPGHASRPPAETSAGILCRSIVRLEKYQCRSMLLPVIKNMLESVIPLVSFRRKLILSNLWLFKPFVLKHLIENPETAALIRTTTSPTMLQGSSKENILPGSTSALVNFRILPGESIREVVAHVKRVIRDPRVDVEMVDNFSISEPSAISDKTASGFLAIEKSINHVFPDCTVLPSIFIAATDSRRFAEISGNIYRFVPVRLGKAGIGLLHGTNERISEQNYLDAVEFYIQVLTRVSD